MKKKGAKGRQFRKSKNNHNKRQNDKISKPHNNKSKESGFTRKN